jgi:hypothetical protein
MVPRLINDAVSTLEVIEWQMRWLVAKNLEGGDNI